MSNDEIDLLVGAYGHTGDTGTQVAAFLHGLRCKCDLTSVNVFCVVREHRPVVIDAQVVVRTCPLPPASTCREDASRFADWMVCNVGTAPWVIVSHFDVVFLGDYIRFVREQMPHASMVGSHHDGVVMVNRAAYAQCQVGFCGLDGMRLVSADSDVRILPATAPGTRDGRYVLSLDVGELLALRMHTLGFNHVWLRRGDDVGKSDLFTHTRRGSGHGGKGGDNDS